MALNEAIQFIQISILCSRFSSGQAVGFNQRNNARKRWGITGGRKGDIGKKKGMDIQYYLAVG